MDGGAQGVSMVQGQPVGSFADAMRAAVAQNEAGGGKVEPVSENELMNQYVSRLPTRDSGGFNPQGRSMESLLAR